MNCVVAKTLTNHIDKTWKISNDILNKDINAPNGLTNSATYKFLQRYQ